MWVYILFKSFEDYKHAYCYYFLRSFSFQFSRVPSRFTTLWPASLITRVTKIRRQQSTSICELTRCGRELHCITQPAVELVGWGFYPFICLQLYYIENCSRCRYRLLAEKSINLSPLCMRRAL